MIAIDIIKFQFHKRKSGGGDAIGKLVFLEEYRDVPFDIKRIYYMYGMEEGIRRGFHAHKELTQALICIHGSCTIMLDDGTQRVDIDLYDPAEGLFIDKAIWREMYNFSSDAVLLVLASDYYNESDYIRYYDDFIKYVESMRKKD